MSEAAGKRQSDCKTAADDDASENKNDKKDDIDELDVLRNEMGRLGGAGHYFQNDRNKLNGGVRNEMNREEIAKVLRLLSLGESE